MAKPATVKEVARLADVSTGTVSNYLNHSKPIAPRTRARIEEAIEQLGYIPNAGVRVVLGQRSPALAFLIPDSRNPFLAEVARGIEDVAVSAGYVVVVCNTNGDVSREEHYAQALSEMRVAGVVAMAMSAGEPALRRLESSGARVVVVGERSGPGFIGIDLDNELGGYLAMRHLLELGHRRIAFVDGPGAQPQTEDRFRGARRACRERGLTDASLIRLQAEGNTTAARIAVARQVLQLHGVTAAQCANDLIALSLRSVCLESGIGIPDDLAIIGYDDVEEAASLPVPLSTVRQPQYELGVTAARLILDHVDDAESVAPSFHPELIVRGSTVNDAP